MDKLFSITDVVMIGNRLTTILAEVRAKTDMRLQVKFGISEDGIQSQQHTVVVSADPGPQQRFDVGERDFKFLRWTGVKIEVAAHKRVEALRASRANMSGRDLNGHPSALTS